MQILLQSWPFIAILLNIWPCAAYIKNPYGVGKGKGKWYLRFSLFFLLTAFATVFSVSLYYSNQHPSTEPVYSIYPIILTVFYPFLMLVFSAVGKRRIISPKQLANFLLFRPVNLAEQPVALYPEGTRVINSTTRHRYPFFAVAIASLSVVVTSGTLIFAELQTCNTLDISFGISGCRGEMMEGYKTIQIVSYSPNGSHLAISGSDGLLQLVNPQTLDQQQSLSGIGTWTDAATFSADSSLMASASWDGAVRIWRVADGSLWQKLMIVRNKEDRNVDLTFSPDNSLLAAGSGSNGIRIWRVSDGTLVHSLATTDYSVTFTPDGKQLVSQSTDGKNNIVFWNISDWSIAKTLPAQAGILVLIKNGSQIITSNKNGVEVWDIASQKLVHQLPLQFSTIAVSADGNTLAIPNIHKFTRIELWDINSGKMVKSWIVPTNDELTSLSFSPNGKNLAVANFFQLVQIWKIAL